MSTKYPCGCTDVTMCIVHEQQAKNEKDQMTNDEILAQCQLAAMQELARIESRIVQGFTEAEREVFKAAFLAGVQHGLKIAQELNKQSNKEMS